MINTREMGEGEEESGGEREGEGRGERRGGRGCVGQCLVMHEAHVSVS